MLIDEVKKAAHELFPFLTELRKINGRCCIIQADSQEVLGAGASWAKALQNAAKLHRQALIQGRRERQANERVARVEAGQFVEFLRQKFAADFEAWKATGGFRTSAQAVCPEDLKEPNGPPPTGPARCDP